MSCSRYRPAPSTFPGSKLANRHHSLRFCERSSIEELDVRQTQPVNAGATGSAGGAEVVDVVGGSGSVSDNTSV